MKVHLAIKDKTGILSVTGSIAKLEDSEKLHSAILSCNSENIEVSFLDARMLPATTILFLQEVVKLGRFKKMKIIVFYRYLSAYLSRLGIRNNLHQDSNKSSLQDKKVQAIAIGGSAGSLDKILSIMSAIPISDAAIFIVQHVLENAPNYLSDLLESRTKYRIANVSDMLDIEKGCVYIAPPAHHMVVEKGKIRLLKEDKVSFARPSVSRLFETVSREYRTNLIAILLCGYGNDGTSAISEMQKTGATIIIEDAEGCEAKDMLLNAWKTGAVDYRFPLPELISYLSRRISNEVSEISNQDLFLFLNAVNEKYGYNYLSYEKESIKRRVTHGMAELGIHSFYRFKELVLSDEDIFEFLFLEFSINVTELFRDPEMYLALREEIIPYLASFPHVKIWSAGCSTGHEPYSLAILMDECGLFSRTQIYASDINPYVVEEAKIGLVANAQFQKGLVNYKKCKGTKDLQKHFNQHEEIYQLSDHLLSRILFFQHSLLNKGSFHEFQLILCRNVLIYFNKELQQQVLSLFVQSLDLNGFLVLGKNETITSSITGLKLVDKANNIYKKIQ